LNIFTVVGARPQFIKAAVTTLAIDQHNLSTISGQIKQVLLHTGQHSDSKMSTEFFELLNLPEPKYRLNCGGLSHGAMTGKMMEQIELILESEDPDYLMCFGDTNSTLAAALVASKMEIPIVHVEAGLRSFDMSMPEEINRVLTDRLSSVLFCPSNQAKQLLGSEGFPYSLSTEKGKFRQQVIEVVGDVMFDATRIFANKCLASEEISCLGLEPNKFILVTVHRPANVDSILNLTSILKALDGLSGSFDIVFPLHPRTRKNIDLFGISLYGSRIKFVDPVGYFAMQKLISDCLFVLTDSGGLQKEAYFHGKPCGVLRSNTEWTELIDEGGHALLGANSEQILSFGEEYSSNSFENIKEIRSEGIYGNGCAGARIIEVLAGL